MAMAAIRNENIEKFQYTIVDVNLASALQEQLQNSYDPRILAYHESLADIIGQSPTLSLLLTSHKTTQKPFFVNACVYLPAHNEIYLTSSLLTSASSSHLPQVLISKVELKRDVQSQAIESTLWQKLRSPPSMPNPAGACAYESGLVYCCQGTLSSSSCLVFFPRNKPPIEIVAHYGGKEFNSLQRVSVSPKDGSLWFTDSAVGCELGIRAQAVLPNLVYRYDVRGRATRAVADGMDSPGAIAFAPDGETVYISDLGSGTKAESGALRAAPIYAYDTITRHGQPFLTNKRVFAVPFRGVAASLLCDEAGNVYAACGDGVEIWNAGGVPLGLIEVAGGCSSFCFGEDRELFIGAGQRLWMVDMRQSE